MQYEVSYTDPSKADRKRKRFNADDFLPSDVERRLTNKGMRDIEVVNLDDLPDEMPLDVYGSPEVPRGYTPATGPKVEPAIPSGRKSTGATIGWCMVIASLLSVGIVILACFFSGDPVAIGSALGLGCVVWSIVGGCLLVRGAVLERN